MAGLLKRLFGSDDRSPVVPISHIEKLDLRAGDTLAVQVDGHLTGEMAERLKALLEANVPEGVKTLVTDKSARLTVIRAPLPPASNQ